MNIHHLRDHQNHQEFLQELKRMIEEINRPPDQIILDETELCEKLHISKRHSADLRKEGKIKYSKDGGKLYYKLSWVLEYIDKYAVALPHENNKKSKGGRYGLY